MCNENEWIVRDAFLAYDRGDIARMLEFVDPGLEWTYLDPALEDPRPQACRGRDELERALRRQVEVGLRSELEEVVAAGDLGRAGDDRTYDVVTVRNRLIVALHACRDHSEARSLAGIS